MSSIVMKIVVVAIVVPLVLACGLSIAPPDPGRPVADGLVVSSPLRSNQVPGVGESSFLTFLPICTIPVWRFRPLRLRLRLRVRRATRQMGGWRRLRWGGAASRT